MPLMKLKSYFRTMALVLALMIVPASIAGAQDISSLLEKADQKAKEVVIKPTISRVSELPHLPVNLGQYEFLLNHPRLAMVLARAYDPSLDLYKVTVRPDGLIHIDDPAGLAGDMELIDSAPGRRVYFVSGHFDIFKLRFYGYVVLLMSYSERISEAASWVDVTATNYIKVNSAFVGFVARIMTFLFPKKVDERIDRFTNAIRKVSVAVHDDPARAYSVLAASGEIGQQELKEFAGFFLRKA
jgi:hypothetical protein